MTEQYPIDRLKDVFEVYAHLSKRFERLKTQMRPEHYARIFLDVAKANGFFLVFGCGEDTPLWLNANYDGYTRLLEDLPEYVRLGKAKGGYVYQVKYASVNKVWMEPVAFPTWLGEDCLTTPWDYILVDAPRGYGDGPGREQSIYLASELRKKHGSQVYVHDTNREWEKMCCDKYLGSADEVLGDSKSQLSIWRKLPSRPSDGTT